MLLTILVASIGLGCAWFRRDLGRTAPIKLLWWPLLVVAVVARLIAVVADGNLAVFAEVSMLTALLWFCLRNVTITGLSIVALGLTANLLVVAINEGTPVRPSAAVSAGVLDADQLTTSDFSGPRHLETAEDRLSFLGDTVPIGLTNQVLSFGDLILLAGLGNVAFTAGRSMFVGRRESESELSTPQVLEPDPTPVENRWAARPGAAAWSTDAEPFGSGEAETADDDEVIDIDELERTGVATITAPSPTEVDPVEEIDLADTVTAETDNGDEGGPSPADAQEIDLRARNPKTGKLVDRQARTSESSRSAPEVDPDVAAAFGYGETATESATVPKVEDEGVDRTGAESSGPYQVRVVESATIAAAFKWDEPTTDLELINASDIDNADTARRDGGLGWPAQPAMFSEPDPTKTASPGDLPRADAAEEARLDAAFGPLTNQTDANVVPLMANEGRPPLVVRAPKAGGLTPEPTPTKGDAFDGVDVVVVKSRFIPRHRMTTPATETERAPQPAAESTTRPATNERRSTAGGWVVAEGPVRESAATESVPTRPASPESTDSDTDDHDASEPTNVVELDRARLAAQLSDNAVIGPVLTRAESQDGRIDTIPGAKHSADGVLDLVEPTAPAAEDTTETPSSPVIDIDATSSDASDGSDGAAPAIDPAVIRLGEGSATRSTADHAKPLVNSLAQRSDLSVVPDPVEE